MIIEFKIDNPYAYLTDIAKQLNTSIENNKIILPNQLGNGFLHDIRFHDQFSLSYFEFTIKKTIRIERKKSDNNNVIPLIFWISNSDIINETDNVKNFIGKDQPYGIFFISNNIETSYVFPANQLIKNFTIIIDKNWLRENVSKNNNYINKSILNDKSSFMLYEPITVEMLSNLDQIEHIFRQINTYDISRLELSYLALSLLTMFFNKLLNRDLEMHYGISNQTEITKMLTVRKILSENFIEIPSGDFLAREVGMNKRKIQKCFKQIFGISVYQFALSVKMNEAKKLLYTKEYSVSEVGYMVGYSNLSHFTETFKKQFGYTPNKYKSSV